jgi:hypothetical protein
MCVAWFTSTRVVALRKLWCCCFHCELLSSPLPLPLLCCSALAFPWARPPTQHGLKTCLYILMLEGARLYSLLLLDPWIYFVQYPIRLVLQDLFQSILCTSFSLSSPPPSLPPVLLPHHHFLHNPLPYSPPTFSPTFSTSFPALAALRAST